MKSVLIFLGSLFALILLVIAGFVAYFFLSGVGPELDAESKAWVDSIVPEVLSSWDSELFIRNSSPVLLQNSPENEIENLMETFSNQLGNMTEYKGSQGQAGIHINNGVKTITAEYVAAATFDGGPASVSIVGVKEDGEWKILNFFVQYGS